MGSSCSSIVNFDGHIRNFPKNVDNKKTLPKDKTYGEFCLSLEQIKTLEETWNVIGDKEKFSENVFLKIFQLDPSLKSLFRYEKFETREQLLSAPKFQNHASNFGSFLNMIIGNLKHYESVAVKACKVIGSKHVDFAKGRPFDPKMWQVFVAALLHEIESVLKFNNYFGSHQNTNKVIVSTWADLFGKVTRVMEDAYHGEQKTMR